MKMSGGRTHLEEAADSHLIVEKAGGSPGWKLGALWR
jgi:hypothetical protein